MSRSKGWQGPRDRNKDVEAGAALVVGRDAERITAAAIRLLDEPTAYAAMAVPRQVFGDGNASSHIVDALLSWQAGSRVAADRSAP